MGLSQSFIAELEQEAGATRRVLQRVPEDELDWRPHPRSFSLGQLALHVATIPGNVSQLAKQNVTTMPAFVQPEPGSRAEILEAHEASVAAGKAALAELLIDLRLLDVPVPAVYGVSADENPLA